jgi:hypothetical protein
MKKIILKKILIFSCLVFVFGGLPSMRLYADTVCPQGTIIAPDGVTCVSTDQSYHLLSPLPCESNSSSEGCVGGQLKSFDPTGTGGGNLGKYLNIMIRIFIGICAVLAVIMIVIGGIEYMTSGLISSKEAGKDRMYGAVLGLLLALGAWTLLYQINPDLLKTDLNSLTDQTVEVDLQADIPQTPVNGKYASGAAVGEVWWDGTSGALASLPAGVSVYNSQCTKVGQNSCTSTKGLRLDYINTILTKCPQCKPLSIQGGTEYWLHGGASGSTTHTPNSPTVDLGLNSTLTAYIKSGTKTSEHRWTKDGISYLDETGTKNHWHAGR